MADHTGVSPQTANKYTNPSVYLTQCVTRNREPTGADYRQPETGKLYPFNSFWLIGKNPTTGTQGDLWYLSKIVSNVAFWLKLSSGTIGPLLNITVPNGVSPIQPDGTGTVNFTSNNGSIVITGSAANPNNHTINFDLPGSGQALETLSDNDNVQVTPLANNIQLKGQLNELVGFFSTTVSDPLNHLIKINPMSSARWIVDPLSTADNPNGTHTTITDAITSATSGDTIVLMPGTYIEDPVVKPGINIVAYGSDSSLNKTGKVIIKGNVTMTTAGSVTLSGLQLETNGSQFLTVSGSAASVVNLINCYLNCSDADGISYTSSSASSAINMTSCRGDIGTTGITLFNSSSTGSITPTYTLIGNSGLSTKASTISAGVLNTAYSIFGFPLTTSGTSTFLSGNSSFNTTLLSVTSLTCGGSGLNIASSSSFSSNTATAIDISSNLLLIDSLIASQNAIAISGVGTLSYSDLIFSDTSAKISVTTQTGGTTKGGLTQAPSPGYVGEYFINTGTNVGISSGVSTNIASIALTPGIYNISMNCNFLNTGNTTVFKAGISDTSATFLDNVSIDTAVWSNTTAINSLQFNLGLADYRVIVTTPKTYYLVGTSTFTTGTSVASGGTIRATRTA